MAYVLVQHLPPERESMVAELLSNKASIPVVQVADGMKVEVDHAYVIRPGHTLTIKDGHLHLGAPVDKPRHSRPVDDFFRSLAAEQRERAICIIMSGMGSNGTQGAQEVKAVGGICIAQDPLSAKFPSMPQHLIDSGQTDYILRPAEMPAMLLDYAAHPYARDSFEGHTEVQRDRQAMTEIISVLRTRTSHDFSGYKKPTVLRRIQRRMSLNRLTSLEEYVKVFRRSPGEVGLLADVLMIHVTGFFRDVEAWEALRTGVIGPLVESRDQDASIRCWVTACASGEEAYTLAMLLVEAAEAAKKRLDIKIFATDTGERTLNMARAGLFPGGIEAEMSPERLERFFEKVDAKYRVRKELREMVIFAPQNVLQDPPFPRLDICTCRNLLIYLEPEMQRHVLSVIHFGLRSEGALFLGTSETVGGADEMFVPIDKKWRIFRRVGRTRHDSLRLAPNHELLGGAAARAADLPLARGSIAQMTARVLLEHYTPPAVTVDRALRIQYFHGNTEPFLAQPRGEPTRDLLEIAREPMRATLRMALQQATESNGPVTVRDGFVDTPRGRRRVEITVAPLSPKACDHFVVTFWEREEAPPSKARKPGADEESLATGAELQRVRDELQTTIEDLQTSNEEMKAAHEESVSINEELQSTNEELETSKEELQSLNEELNTVNAQLQAKMDELESTSSDMESLLSSTELAVVFLDLNMRIRRFTPAAGDLMQFIAADVGRPLSDLAQKFSDPHLIRDTKMVLQKLTTVASEVQSDSGRAYLRRITPYRTVDNRINGVVVTFLDITGQRRAELLLSDTRAQFQAILDQLPIGVVVASPTGAITMANQAVSAIFASSGPPGRTIDEFRQWQPRRVDGTPYEVSQYPMIRALQERDAVKAEPMWFRRADGQDVLVAVSAAAVCDDEGKVMAGVITFSDITAHHQSDKDVQETAATQRSLIHSLPVGVVRVDAEQVIQSVNPEAERILERSAADLLGKTIQDGSNIVDEDESSIPAANMPIATALRTARPVTDVVLGLRRLAEETRWVSINVVPLFHPAEERPHGAVCSFVDVTLHRDREADRDALLQSEQAAHRQAQEATRLKDEFLSTISHELRTPLAVINIWAKMLREAHVTPQQMKEGLDAIDQSAQMQKRLIDDLLDSAKSQAGKLRLERKMVELAPVVRDAIDAILPTAQAKGVKLEAHLSPDAGTGSADPERLRQVVWNLLTNAVKFTPAKGEIKVDLKRQGDQVTIAVADTGRGIAPDFLPQLFLPFRQADTSASRPQVGLGLGLAISRQLVELHGGTIEAQSAGTGQGSTFTVRLPLPVVRAPQGDVPRAAEGGGAMVRTLKGVAILLVEDEPQTRRALTTVLESEGAFITPVGNSAEAIEAFAAKRPHLFLSDIGLPGEDGYSLIRRLRALETAKPSNGGRVPAVALTAFTRDDERRRALSAGFDRHIAKPVDPAHLVAVLLEVMTEKR